MQIYSGDLLSMPPIQDPTVLTIGNFDGLHKGHVFLLKELLQLARQKSCAAAVVTFEPHPSRFFSKQPELPLLVAELRHQRFAALGVDHLIVQTFDKTFSEVEPEDFLRQYLLPRIPLKALLLGYDFHFGRASRGDFNLAKKCLATQSLDVLQAAAFNHQAGEVSSTRVRKNLLAGRVAIANALLGYDYSIRGQVVKGQALGRQLGFPTANMDSIQVILPAPGVYSGAVKIDEKVYSALLNIGQKPTLGANQEKTCECHIVGYSGDLYGDELIFYFRKKIRDETKFASLEELKVQIAKDVSEASREPVEIRDWL